MIRLSLPEEILSPLFKDVALSNIISDGKIWADAIPRFAIYIILNQYQLEKDKSDFSLKNFIGENFELTKASTSTFVSDTSMSVTEHINSLWSFLTRQSDMQVEGSSLIPLPYPYVVPGGRFNEIYYWDSYFTMLGLRVSGKNDLIASMVDNFAWLIREVGFIPNGNRTYFLSRSQPPYFSLMVSLLSEIFGEAILIKYKDELVLEYKFWMENVGHNSSGHCINLNGAHMLNRYYDLLNTPRSEMYSEDVHLSSSFSGDPSSLYQHMRSACESGWDFSSRWCSDPCAIASIHTGDILPVDLNCLLFHLEVTIARVMSLQGHKMEADVYAANAEQRKNLIIEYFWDEESGYFFDFDFVRGKRTGSINAAGIFPLFFKVATQEQGERSLLFLSKNLLKEGGIVTTNINSGQQWDAPNGWAPLQWISVVAALNYNNTTLATTIISNWTKLNQKVFNETGKMLEKYDVVESGKLGGGGEYPVQDGFGWTNGVYLAMKSLEISIGSKM